MFRWMRDLRRAQKRVQRALRKGPFFDIDALAPRLRAMTRAYRHAWNMNGAVEAMADEYAPERDEPLETMLDQARLGQIQSDHGVAEWLDMTAELLDQKGQLLRDIREALPDLVRLALHGGDDPEAVRARSILEHIDPDHIDEFIDDLRRRESLCGECAGELRTESVALAERAAAAIVKRHHR